MLKDAAALIRKISHSEDLSSDEARQLFNIVGDEDTDGYYHTAAYCGLMAKTPTIDELYGFCLDRSDRVGKVDVDIPADQITDMSGGGGDTLKTMNVSTAAGFVVAASGLFVAKQAAGAFSGFTGSSDVCLEIGVDVPFENCEPKKIKDGLKKNNIFVYNYACLAPDRFGLYLNWRKAMVKSGLTFYIPQHIASYAYSPIPLGSRVYGLAAEKHLHLLANLLQKLGIRRGLVLFGLDGLDEVSIIGETKFVEFNEDGIDEYTVSPKDLGVKQATIMDIKAESREGNIIDFLRVLFGKEKGPKRDLVAVNAGASLYVANRVKSLKEGTELATSLLDDGDVRALMEKTVNYYGNSDKLNNWKKKAGID